MCNVQDAEDDAARPKPLLPESLGRNCMKCGAGAAAIGRTKDPFCRDCYNAYFTHRFRATFGRAKVVRQGERALLAFSGGTSSRVLLRLVEEGLHESTAKKLRFTPSILYIDEGSVLNLSVEDRLDISADVLSAAHCTGFPLYFATLEEVCGSYRIWSIQNGSIEQIVKHSTSLEEDIDKYSMEPSNTRQTLSQEKDSDKIVADTDFPTTDKDTIKHYLLQCNPFDSPVLKQLQNLFQSAESLTAKENLILSLRRQLLVTVAAQLNCTKVLLGDNASRLSVRLLSNVSQGRGGAVPLDTGFCDDRDKVAILRPLREFPAQEVASYAALNRLKVIPLPKLSTMTPERASIERLTESFINKLQVDFPSTINTIFRLVLPCHNLIHRLQQQPGSPINRSLIKTGDKLTIGESTAICRLCKGPHQALIDDEVFSHLTPSNDGNPMWHELCYGCRVTAKDLDILQLQELLH